MYASAVILTEYQSTYFPADSLSTEDGIFLTANYRSVVRLEGPSATNQNRWKVTAQGWCGQLQLPSGTELIIQPKVPIEHLFQMIATVYRLDRFGGLASSTADGRVADMVDLFELLVARLIELTSQRLRRGLYRTYVEHKQRGEVIRGEVDTTWMATHPASSTIVTRSSQLTADVWHNRVIVYTLSQLQTVSWRTPGLQREIGWLLRQLPVSIVPVVAEDVDPESIPFGREYEDYRALHALCRLLLEGISPLRPGGKRLFFTFLIDMALLFERFVADRLQHYLPEPYRLYRQPRRRLSATESRFVTPDLILQDRAGETLLVLDTKYKGVDRPALDDLYQVTFYAREFHCDRAGLIYPQGVAQPLNGINREVAYHTLVYDLAQPLEQAGKRLVEEILRVAL